MRAPMNSSNYMGSKVDFSMFMLTPREERCVSSMEIEAQASLLDRVASSLSSK